MSLFDGLSIQITVECLDGESVVAGRETSPYDITYFPFIPYDDYAYRLTVWFQDHYHAHDFARLHLATTIGGKHYSGKFLHPLSIGFQQELLDGYIVKTLMPDRVPEVKLKTYTEIELNQTSHVPTMTIIRSEAEHIEDENVSLRTYPLMEMHPDRRYALFHFLLGNRWTAYWQDEDGAEHYLYAPDRDVLFRYVLGAMERCRDLYYRENCQLRFSQSLAFMIAWLEKYPEYRTKLAAFMCSLFDMNNPLLLQYFKSVSRVIEVLHLDTTDLLYQKVYGQDGWLKNRQVELNELKHETA